MLKILELAENKNLNSKQMADVRGGFYSFISAWRYPGGSAKAYPTIPNYGYVPSKSTGFGITTPDI